MKLPSRSGFTLIEILVVIAIIGVMVGLLLPAVQSTRENARAASCKNNMINVHLAIESYHEAFGVYPAGTVTDRLPARMFPDGKDHSWLVQVRPFLDGGFRFAEQWSPVHSAYHPSNWKLAKMAPGVLACPSSPFTHMSDVTPLSYVGIHDGIDAPIDVDSGGVFVANRFMHRRDISDGLSHTLQVGEILVEAGDTFFWIAGNQSTLRTTALPLQFPTYGGRWFASGSVEDRVGIAYGLFADPPTITHEMLANEVARISLDSGMESGLDSEAMPAAIDAALLEINDRLIAANPVTANNQADQFNPGVPQFTAPKIGADATKPMRLGSTHEAMIHGVFADGRVVSINQAIDSTLFSQIGIRNDALPLEKPLIQTQ